VIRKAPTIIGRNCGLVDCVFVDVTCDAKADREATFSIAPPNCKTALEEMVTVEKKPSKSHASCVLDVL
jgi:hypothetical protein